MSLWLFVDLEDVKHSAGILAVLDVLEAATEAARVDVRAIARDVRDAPDVEARALIVVVDAGELVLEVVRGVPGVVREVVPDVPEAAQEVALEAAQERVQERVITSVTRRVPRWKHLKQSRTWERISHWDISLRRLTILL